MICNVSYWLNLYPLYFTHMHRYPAAAALHLVRRHGCPAGPERTRTHNQDFVPVTDCRISGYDTGGEDISLRNEIVDMHPVAIRNNLPAVKRGTEHAGTGINGEELDIVPAVEDFREMPPQGCSLCINIAVELVGDHAMEPVILYLPLTGKSSIEGR